VAAEDILRLREYGSLREQASRSERLRLADEVHETMNVLATGAMWEADGLAEIAELPSEATYSLDRMRQAMRRIYQDLKYILDDLRDAELEAQGLVAVLESYATIIGHGLIKVAGDRERRVPDKYMNVLCRIGHEAMSNAVKHSKIKQREDGTIRLSVQFGPSSVELRVIDNGAGFDTERTLRKRAIPSGLIRLRELAESAGIQFEVQSRVGEGTKIFARVDFGTEWTAEGVQHV
jgi:signal transduction histidine kinase